MMYNFPIIELGGKEAKADRIMRLIPYFQQQKIWLPDRCVRKNCEGGVEDLVETFMKEEYLAFPSTNHDDMLDVMSRILDKKMNLQRPEHTARRRKNNRAKMEYQAF